MRLDQNQRIYITNTVQQFDPQAKVRLFGSRLDDEAVGGDIDLLIESKTIGFKEKLIIRYQLKEKLGNRKIDVILMDKPDSAFTRFVYKNSLVL